MCLEDVRKHKLPSTDQDSAETQHGHEAEVTLHCDESSVLCGEEPIAISLEHESIYSRARLVLFPASSCPSCRILCPSIFQKRGVRAPAARHRLNLARWWYSTASFGRCRVLLSKDAPQQVP